MSTPSPKKLGLPKRPPTVARDASQTEHLQARVDEQVRELLAHQDGSLDSTDPEELHQFRVAIRRLRSLLKNSSRFGDDGRFARDELRWIGGVTSPVRDLDVLLMRLHEDIADFDAPDAEAAALLIAELEDERDEDRAALAEALAGDRYVELLNTLTKLATAKESELEGSPSVADIPGTKLINSVHKPYRKLERAVDKLDEEPPDDDLHALRIHAKRLRYAAETAMPSAEDGQAKDLKSVVKACKALQDVLGDHQDAVVAADRVRGIVDQRADLPATVAVVAGRIIEREYNRRAELRTLWPQAWRRITDATSPVL